MNFISYSDQQILDEIRETRTELERMQSELESGKDNFTYNEMRSKMSQLNLLKIETRRRRLNEGEKR